MKKQFIIILLLITSLSFGQDDSVTNSKKGEFSLGIRTTGSIFSASGNNLGLGAGGQIRYRISEKLATEWFADWITTDIDGLGQRKDAHIGMSMFIYPTKRVGVKNTFTPYILGGLCLDYTKMQTNLYFNDIQEAYIKDTKDRWSYATQLGLGTHYNFTEKIDISFSAQYVLHFGDDLYSETEMNDSDQEYLNIYQESGSGLEGHFFMSISVNFVVFNVLKNK